MGPQSLAPIYWHLVTGAPNRLLFRGLLLLPSAARGPLPPATNYCGVLPLGVTLCGLLKAVMLLMLIRLAAPCVAMLLYNQC